jgi:hypothetical protein
VTARKRDLPLPARTPAYVSRNVGAAELCISPETWDEWVKTGILPPPRYLGTTGKNPRWKWSEVEARLDRGAEWSPEPFFREVGREKRRASS